MPECVFCAIAAHEVPAAIVFEDGETVAFLDARPLFHGHVLLCPREHVETLPDLPAGRVAPLFTRAQALCDAVREAMGSQGTFVAINNTVSQSVPHLHVHVVPRTKGDGLRGFFWPRTKYAGDAQRDEVAARIRAQLTDGSGGMRATSR